MKYLIQSKEFDQEEFEYYVYLAGSMEINNDLNKFSNKFLGFALNKLTPGHKLDFQNRYYEENIKQLLSGEMLTINEYKFKIEE